MSTLRVTVKIRKYLWKEFVHDVAFVLYATIIIFQALHRRYLNSSIPNMVREAESFLKYAVLFFALLFVGVVGLMFTVGIPVVLILAALGKIS